MTSKEATKTLETLITNLKKPQCPVEMTRLAASILQNLLNDMNKETESCGSAMTPK